MLIWSLGWVFCVPTSTSLEIYTYDLSLNNFWYIKHKNPFLEKVSISEENFYKYNSGHVHKTTDYSHVQKSIKNWSVCKNGPRRSRRVTPMMMPHPCPSGSRLLKTLFKSHNFFVRENWLVRLWPKIPLKLVIFPLWKSYEI